MKYSKRQYFAFCMSCIFLLFFTHCGPKLRPRGNATQTETPPPNDDIVYENEAAQLTVVIPKSDSQNGGAYQAPPKKILNNNKTEVLLNHLTLMDTKIAYNSIDKKMNVTGRILILSQKDKPLSEHSFSLMGIHETDQVNFTLNDQLHNNNLNQDSNKPIVKAKAHCIGPTNLNTTVNCNHVVVDIFVLHQETYYTEQIEVNRIKNPPAVPEPEQPLEPLEPTEPVKPATPPEPPPEVPSQPPAEPVTPPTTPAPPSPAEPATPSDDSKNTPNNNEPIDHGDAKQEEKSDESIPGRYQGSAATADLTELFSEKSKTPPVPPQKAPLPPPNIQQTERGDIRPINQSIGFPNSGYLQNSTSLLERQTALDFKAFFELVSPQRKTHFGTYEMAEILTQIGNYIHENYSRKLYVSNISSARGGLLKPHASHQNGLDVDLGYIADNPNLKFPLVVKTSSKQYFSENISIEKTYNLFMHLFMQNEIPIERIFVDQKIKNELCKFAKTQFTQTQRTQSEVTPEHKNAIKTMFITLQHVEGHGDHFHLRIRCSKFDPACRDRIYKKMDDCLFN